MKSMFRGCVLLAALMAAAPGWANESDEETQAVFAHLLKTHADSVVRVSFVIVSAYGGQEQRQESSVTGVVVDEGSAGCQGRAPCVRSRQRPG